MKRTSNADDRYRRDAFEGAESSNPSTRGNGSGRDFEQRLKKRGGAPSARRREGWVTGIEPATFRATI
jgi:hypothetical protein